MNDLVKNLLVTLAVGLVLLTVFKSFTPAFQAPTDEVNYTAFLEEVKQDKVRKVQFTESGAGGVTALTFERADGSKGVAYGPYDRDLVNDLVRHKVEQLRHFAQMFQKGRDIGRKAAEDEAPIVCEGG